jgi:hypothetical protein
MQHPNWSVASNTERDVHAAQDVVVSLRNRICQASHTDGGNADKSTRNCSHTLRMT